jgi:iron complex outermembrane recepter protein
MFRIVLLCLFPGIFISCFSYSQQVPANKSISVKIADENKKPVSSAFVSLYNSKDSSLVKINSTDEGGIVLFESVRQGNYYISVTHTSFKTYSSNFFSVAEDMKLPDIILVQKTGELKEVTVNSQKPFIEKQIDKMVVNVENSIVSAGSSVMEVLEKSPGVVIDRNDNISLKGKQGVIIMINGKPSGLSGSDLANFLRAMPSGSVSKIEIITNPSAKYDAAGNAGIINIIMKKDQRLGTNGTITTNYGQGFYPRAGAGFTLNHRTKKLNLFGNYNFDYRDNYADLSLYRQFIDSGKLKGVYDQTNFIEFLFKTHVYRAGIDYNISKKTTLGLVVNGIANRFSSDGNTHTDVLNNLQQKVSYNNNFSRTLDTLHMNSINANFRHSFDSTGKELSIDLDYAHYHNRDGQRFITDYYLLNGDPASPRNIITGDVDGRLTIKSFKADYTNPLKKNAKLETGIKSSVVKADNDIKYYDNSSGIPLFDANLSNHFIYEENINAAYINFSKEFKKISIQFGLRAEQTNAKGNQVTTGQKFDTSYTKFFPSAFFNYNASEKNSFGLSVSRRLDRPSYKQLNPFRFYINNSTYSVGNPYLQPQFTYSFELSHTYNQKITTTLSYSITKNNILNVIIPSTTQDKITIQTDQNLAEVDYYSLAVSAPLQITKWWNSINNFTAYYNFYKGELANTNIQNGKPTFNINSNNSFSIGKKGLTAELSGFYQYRELYAYMDVQSFGMLSMGVAQPVLKKKATLKLNIADIFHSNANTANNKYRDYIEDFHVKHDTRVATISFTYRFGNTKIAAARRMNGGAEEEKQRAK